MQINKIALATLANGALEELFENELDKIIENINDPNTSIKKARKIAIELKFSPIDGQKTYLCQAEAELPAISYDSYYSSEDFNILLQSRFCPSDTTRKLLSIVGNVKATDVQTKSDNGITQTVHTNKGVVLQEDTVLPNPVELAPFRTFVEINQVSSAFIFRAKAKKDHYSDDKETKDIQFALFEADGGAWKIEATRRIKTYLEEAFKDTGVVILA